MTTIKTILEHLEKLGVRLVSDRDELQVIYDETLAEDLKPVLDELKAHKSEILSELEAISYAEGGIIDGHEVSKIIWETDEIIVFKDNKGRFWRRIHSYNETWPVLLL